MEVQHRASSGQKNPELSSLIYAFMVDVRDSPGISVLGFMELNKEAAMTVSDMYYNFFNVLSIQSVVLLAYGNFDVCFKMTCS